MKMTKEESEAWSASWENFVKDFKNVTALAAPTFLHMNLFGNVELCGQDISPHDKGSHTGDIGGFQLEEYVKYCIVGHSERKENLALVKQKISKAKESGITPIVCFTDPELANEYWEEGIIMAWEDPDNIATDGIFKPKNPEDIAKGISTIKSKIKEDTVLLYGGSVNKDNSLSLASIEGVSGALVGTASLDPQHFYQICLAFEN